MFGKKTKAAADARAKPDPAAAARPVPKTAKPASKAQPGSKGQQASKGKQAYESRRAEKAGVGLEKWMAEKERRVQAERDAAQRVRRKPAAAAEKPGLLRRLLDRAHRPL